VSRLHSKSTRVLVNNAHLSGDIRSWSFQHRRNLSSVANLLSGGEEYIPGLLSGSVNITGNFNSGAGNITTILNTARASEGGLLTTFLEGTTIGNLAFISEGNVSSSDTPAQVQDAVRVSIQGTPNDGVDIGVLLHALGAETADSNGTSVDNAAASSNGAVASLHVTAFSGLTSISVRVQHSTDNSAWSDLITFTSVTGTTWQRSTATGTVNRYLRAWWDVTGTGSCTFLVAAARR
jgi:hypothetical protein